MSEHFTQEQILEFLDGTLDSETIESVRSHLEACPACGSAGNELRNLHRALLDLPIEEASPILTKTAMERILATARKPVDFWLFDKMAYVFALAVVLVILGAVFVYTGIISMDETNGEGVSQLQSILDISSTATAEGIRFVSGWITDNIPFHAGSGSLIITVAILVVVTLLAFVDRTIGKKIVGGRT